MYVRVYILKMILHFEIWYSQQQGDVLSLHQQQQRHEHHLRASQYAALSAASAFAGPADAHKYGLINGAGPTLPPHLVAYGREEAAAAGKPSRPFPPLHPRGQPGLAAASAYALQGGGPSPRPLAPQMVPPPPQQGPTPPKLLSPVGKTTISSIARYEYTQNVYVQNISTPGYTALILFLYCPCLY